MKHNYFLLILFAAAAWMIASAPHASATSNCALPNANVCHGFAMAATTTGGVASGRCFSLRITNTAPACSTAGIGTTSNEAGYELPPGTCVTLRWFDVTNGATPPAAPNKVTIRIRFDNVATTIRSFQSAGAEPAAGATFTPCATNDGTSGGTPAAGTFEIFIQAVKDNGPGGVGNYDVNSFNSAGTGSTSHDAGFYLGDMAVSSVARSAYPAGSTFAYGTSGDESVTITGSFTAPNGDNNVETMSEGVLKTDLSAFEENGAAVDVDSGSQAQSFVADNTFATLTHLPATRIRGNSGLAGEHWTKFATTGNGANINVISTSGTLNDVAYDSTQFNLDSGIKFDSVGTHSYASADEIAVVKLGSSSGAVVSVLNKGETYYAEFYMLNARGEKLTRAMSFTREDATPTSCSTTNSITPVAGLYSGTATLATSAVCTTTATTTGSPRYFRATNTMQNHRSNSLFGVSTLYYVDSHIQLSSTLNKDNFPTENANEDTSYIISTLETDTMHLWCHVVSVRKDVNIDTTANEVTRSYIDPTSTNRFTQNTETASDGWTATSLDLLATTPLGAWTAPCSASHDGNSGSDTQTFQIIVPAGALSFPGDPIRVFAIPEMVFSGETVRFTITETLLDGTGRTGNAASTDVNVRDASNTLVVNAAHPTEWQYGSYYYDYTPTTTGYFTVQIKTVDVSTGNNIPGTNGFYVRTAYATATQVSGVAAQVSGVQTSANTIIANQAANLATLIAEIEETEHSQDVLQNYTTQEILDAIHAENVTFTGNFSVDDAKLMNITNYLNDKFGVQGEPVKIDIGNTIVNLLPFAIGVVLLIAGERRKDNVYKLGAGLLFFWSAIFMPLPIQVRIVPLLMGLYMVTHFFQAGQARGETA